VSTRRCVPMGDLHTRLGKRQERWRGTGLANQTYSSYVTAPGTFQADLPPTKWPQSIGRSMGAQRCQAPQDTLYNVVVLSRAHPRAGERWASEGRSGPVRSWPRASSQDWRHRAAVYIRITGTASHSGFLVWGIWSHGFLILTVALLEVGTLIHYDNYGCVLLTQAAVAVVELSITKSVHISEARGPSPTS